jgi:hypothetical protein
MLLGQLQDPKRRTGRTSPQIVDLTRSHERQSAKHNSDDCGACASFEPVVRDDDPV